MAQLTLLRDPVTLDAEIRNFFETGAGTED
jgi:hypothetical protein